MPITINGSGTVTGISAGGLPDACITAPELSGAQTGSAPIYGCRAWVKFDGTRNESDTGASTNGANVKIRASGNVSSVLKNGVGNYTITFTTAMVDANYAYSVDMIYSNGSAPYANLANAVTALAGSIAIISSGSNNGGSYDSANVSVAIFR